MMKMSQTMGIDLNLTQIITMIMMIILVLIMNIGIVKDLNKLKPIKKRIMVIILMILFTITVAISILLKL